MTNNLIFTPERVALVDALEKMRKHFDDMDCGQEECELIFFTETLGSVNHWCGVIEAAITALSNPVMSEGEMREILAVELERLAKEAFPYTQRELRDDAKLLRAGEIAGPRIRAALSAMSQALHRSK